MPKSRNLKASSWLALIAILFLASCAATPPADHPLSQHEDDKHHHARELLVLNPPSGYEKTLPGMGLSVIDITEMEELDFKLYHLKIENGAHPFEARQAHRKRHPTTTVDVHHHFEHHATLPHAELFAANVSHQRKKGDARARSKSILLAVNWLSKQNVDAINFSSGGSYNSLIAEAIKQANAGGILLIASAGNSGPFTKKKNYPAANDQTIAIAASDRVERTAIICSPTPRATGKCPGQIHRMGIGEYQAALLSSRACPTVKSLDFSAAS